MIPAVVLLPSLLARLVVATVIPRNVTNEAIVPTSISRLSRDSAFRAVLSVREYVAVVERVILVIIFFSGLVFRGDRSLGVSVVVVFRRIRWDADGLAIQDGRIL